MSNLELGAGNALTCTVNSHRTGWNGAICETPEQWACAAEQTFREDYCAHGDGRCFHLHLFNAPDPYLDIHGSGAAWVLGNDKHALDNQVLMLLTKGYATEPRGSASDDGALYAIGAYRVDRASYEEWRRPPAWRVRPYKGEWVRFPRIRIRAPYVTSTGGPYFKEMARNDALRLFRDVSDRASAASWWDDSDKARLEQFHESLEKWLDQAAEAIDARRSKRGARSPGHVPAPSRISSPFQQLQNLKLTPEPSTPQTPAATDTPQAGQSSAPAQQSEAPAAEPPAPAPAPKPASAEPIFLVEEPQEPWIEEQYGAEILRSIQLSALTKPLVVLSGPPGVGKSHLAVRMLDDPDRERTLIVPVSATWRGREDLLGYINPVSGQFEPTAFTRFLHKAWRAWDSGDHRQHVVVFEEFNLSQPEHWLSDLLVLCEHTEPADRVLELGGESIRGLEGEPRVPISPVLRMVATVNSDHTTKKLSPRVMDRASIVHIKLLPQTVLKRLGIELPAPMLDAITSLDRLLRPTGASFSLRSGISLRSCLDASGTLGLEQTQVVDAVLTQQVLSKVRLLARDPRDESLLKELERWSEEHAAQLAGCSSRIAEWSESISAGHDVLQA